MPIPYSVHALQDFILAPFRPQEMGPWLHGPIRIDKTNLDQTIEEMGLSLSIPVPKTLCPPGQLALIIRKLRAFHPDELVKNTPFLKNLLEARRFVEKARNDGLSSKEICRRLEEWPDLPPLEITIADQEPKTRPSSPIDDILKIVALPDEVPTPSGKTQPLTAQIDSVFQQVLGHIFCHEGFRDLDSSWRGLRLLMKQGESMES